MAGQMDLREAKDDEGRNALHFAAAKGHLDVCKFLVEELGLDVNCTTTDGERRPPLLKNLARGAKVLCAVTDDRLSSTVCSRRDAGRPSRGRGKGGRPEVPFGTRRRPASNARRRGQHAAALCS